MGSKCSPFGGGFFGTEYITNWNQNVERILGLGNRVIQTEESGTGEENKIEIIKVNGVALEINPEDKSVNIVINDPTPSLGGSGEVNVIEGISLNGKAITPSSKVSNILIKQNNVLLDVEYDLEDTSHKYPFVNISNLTQATLENYLWSNEINLNGLPYKKYRYFPFGDVTLTGITTSQDATTIGTLTFTNLFDATKNKSFDFKIDLSGYQPKLTNELLTRLGLAPGDTVSVSADYTGGVLVASVTINGGTPIKIYAPTAGEAPTVNNAALKWERTDKNLDNTYKVASLFTANSGTDTTINLETIFTEAERNALASGITYSIVLNIPSKAEVDAAKTAAETAATQAATSAANAASAATTAVNNAISALDVNDLAVAGLYVSEVKQEDGKIVVTRATLPTGGNGGGTKVVASEALTSGDILAVDESVAANGTVAKVKKATITHPVATSPTSLGIIGTKGIVGTKNNRTDNTYLMPILLDSDTSMFNGLDIIEVDEAGLYVVDVNMNYKFFIGQNGAGMAGLNLAADYSSGGSTTDSALAGTVAGLSSTVSGLSSSISTLQAQVSRITNILGAFYGSKADGSEDGVITFE